MPVLSLSLIALCLYLACGLIQGLHLFTAAGIPQRRHLLLSAGAVAVLAHGISVFAMINTPLGVDLGFFRVSSLIFWFICTIVLLSALRRPLDNFAIVLGPLAALSIVLALTIGDPVTLRHHISGGILAHILSSILAYSVLSIATIQAALLALQENALKKRHTHGILNALPPLQTMEAMLFEILWVGVILLTLSIATGWLYLEDIFAQHLVHKTVLSITAWLVFATLLWGRHHLGWRSQTAVRWTIGGFIALMLAYFGSKFVLELLLERV